MYAEKLPPHDVDAEEAVVASLLIDGEAINRVTSLIKPDDFYRERNRWCYDACIALYERGDAINQVTVTHELSVRERLDDIGGPAYLSHLIATVPTSVHAEHYARIVNRTATLRRLIQAAGDIANIGYSGTPDVEAALAQAEDAIYRIRTGHAVRDFVTIREVLDRYLEDTAATGGPLERGLAPVPSGFADLDRLLGNLQRGDLLILAARPALGKSTLALNIARNAAVHGAKVAVFSLEMSRDQVALRLLSSEASVDAFRLRSGLYNPATDGSRIMNAIGALSDLAIYIDDSPLQTVMEMRGKARRLFTDRGIDLVIVDYLQLIRGTGNRNESRVLELGEITRSLKGIARELNVPVLALSQLSRYIERRPDHRPQLADLRESGSIEQDADVVMFIHREDKYQSQEEWDQRHPGEPYPENIAELIVAKHRHGPVDEVTLYFDGQLARFEDLNARARG
jgi:replicative DNA helicase